MPAQTAIQQLEKRAARDTIEEAREFFGLNYAELARALDVDRRTLLRHRKMTNTPSLKLRSRMGTLREIRYLLDAVFDREQHRLEWLHTPVDLLRGQRPIDRIRAGALDDVVSVLAGLHSGAHA